MGVSATFASNFAQGFELRQRIQHAKGDRELALEDRDRDFAERQRKAQMEQQEYEGRRDYELARIRRENALAELNELQAGSMRESKEAVGRARELMGGAPRGADGQVVAGPPRSRSFALRDGTEIPPELMELRNRVQDPKDLARLDDEILQYVNQQRMQKAQGRFESYAGTILQQAEAGLLPLSPEMVQTAVQRVAGATTLEEILAGHDFLEEMVNVAGHEMRVLQGRQMLSEFLNKATTRMLESGIGGSEAMSIQKLYLDSLKPPKDNSPEELRRYEESLNDAIMMAAVLSGEQGPAAGQLLQKQMAMAQRAEETRRREMGQAAAFPGSRAEGRRVADLPEPERRALAEQFASMHEAGDREGMARVLQEAGVALTPDVGAELRAVFAPPVPMKDLMQESREQGKTQTPKEADVEQLRRSIASTLPLMPEQEFQALLERFGLPLDTTREEVLEQLPDLLKVGPPPKVMPSGRIEGRRSRRR